MFFYLQWNIYDIVRCGISMIYDIHKGVSVSCFVKYSMKYCYKWYFKNFISMTFRYITSTNGFCIMNRNINFFHVWKKFNFLMISHTKDSCWCRLILPVDLYKLYIIEGINFDLKIIFFVRIWTRYLLLTFCLSKLLYTTPFSLYRYKSVRTINLWCKYETGIIINNNNKFHSIIQQYSKRFQESSLFPCFLTSSLKHAIRKDFLLNSILELPFSLHSTALWISSL